MSFIQFESASEKEKIREELRNAREELLSRAKQKAELRVKAEAEKALRGEDKWMLPSLSEKIEKQSKSLKKAKKSKKSSKEKKSKHKKNKKKKRKENKSEKKKSRHQSSSDEESVDSDAASTNSSDDEWVEKKVDEPAEPKQPVKRDDWMTGTLLLPTYSKNVNNKEKEKSQIDSYDPSKSSRELNPYWKDGGEGLPTFQKPKEDEDYSRSYTSHTKRASGNWRKDRESTKKETSMLARPSKGRKSSRSSSSSPERESRRHSSKSSKKSSNSEETSSFLTDQQMNELGAKLIKAEIMGNEEYAKELKDKLEKARNIRNQIKDRKETEPKSELVKEESSEHILLTTTDNKGVTRPLPNRSSAPLNPYSGKKSKRKNVDTHEEGKRVKYFPDDDRYDIKQMFEREKYATASQSDAQFAEIAGKHKNTKDDLEDIFADKVRKEISEHEEEDKEQKRAIREHEKLSKVLDSCEKCFDSSKMEKQLLVSMGSTAYLALPWHEGLQAGHCLIIPIQHVSSSTQLDEDTWAEINDFRKGLTRMFADRSMDVIFFEIARCLNKRPHMTIHCVASKKFEMAPFYFKKAIQESEYMWSTNKQLISLKDKDLRRAIPKGLPYFWVHFGMESGFAHVIEDQERFPANFAQEIIGGMLELDARMWRKPRREHNSIQKVKQFADWWKPFDFTA